jgi:hypothetical protein
MPHQHPSNIILHTKKNFKMIYRVHMISILNSIFNIVFYAMRWTILYPTCICFLITHHWYKSSPSFVAIDSIAWAFLFFCPVRFVSTQLVLSHPFPLLGATSPPTDIATPPHHVVLPSHGVKMSSPARLHLLAIFHHIASLIKLKLKH